MTADGRGESIWDRFCATPGRSATVRAARWRATTTTGWRDDVELMRRLGLAAYRFSIAWPRVVPTGVGAVNASGLDFYDRLVDGLLEAGIAPAPTLYHWDLPQALEDQGGWAVRDDRRGLRRVRPGRRRAARRPGDNVDDVERAVRVSASRLHRRASTPPAARTSPPAWRPPTTCWSATASRCTRSAKPPHRPPVGIVLNFTPVVAGTDDPADVAEAELVDAFENRWYIEPLTGLGLSRDRRATALAGTVTRCSTATST